MIVSTIDYRLSTMQPQICFIISLGVAWKVEQPTTSNKSRAMIQCYEAKDGIVKSRSCIPIPASARA